MASYSSSVAWMSSETDFRWEKTSSAFDVYVASACPLDLGTYVMRLRRSTKAQSRESLLSRFNALYKTDVSDFRLQYTGRPRHNPRFCTTQDPFLKGNFSRTTHSRSVRVWLFAFRHRPRCFGCFGKSRRAVAVVYVISEEVRMHSSMR